jgi:2-polyprenyl-3-methyl-5-hydroxy-6-metoxy-1,4-benzoquinol methylase
LTSENTSARPLKQWHGQEGDPNVGTLRTERVDVLRAARRADYLNDRAEYLCSLARGKKVLDCGMVEHTLGATTSPGWLHRKICDSARECLGVDILAEEIEALRKAGFNVRTLDVTREALPETFDLIIACEIIEHIDNLGAAFDNWARMLEPGGRLVITTPNPWYINCLLKNVRVASHLAESVDHVGWHEPATLFELASRHGMKLESYTGLFVAQTYTTKAKFFFSLARQLTRLGFRYELFSKSMLYEFVRTEST